MNKKNDLEIFFHELKVYFYGFLSLSAKNFPQWEDRERDFLKKILRHNDEHQEEDLKKRLLYLPKKENIIPCESIKVIAFAFPYDVLSDDSSSEIAVVDEYGWEFDYHLQGEEKLHFLSLKLSEKFSLTQKPEICVDKSLYFERDLARQCGLGTYGKNGCLIHPELGTRFFIGLLIYVNEKNLPLEETTAFKEYELYEKCSNCQACYHACPSKICGNPPLDYRKCVSLITQSKNLPNLEERRWMGNRVYGCSSCQKVCPSNGKQPENLGFLKMNRSLKSQPFLDPEILLQMSQKEFKKMYGMMGFAWRPFWIYKRNILINLLNAANSSDLKWLKQLDFETQHEQVRAIYHDLENLLREN